MFSLHHPRFSTRLRRVQKDICCKASGRGPGGWAKGFFSALLTARGWGEKSKMSTKPSSVIIPCW